MWKELEEGFYYSSDKKNAIIFSKKAVKVLKRFIQDDNKKCEAGGIILGKVRGSYIYVSNITPPARNDIREKYKFYREDKKHTNIYKKTYQKNKCIKYLGEWHTHPEKTPNPSDIDKREWSKIISKIKEPLLFLILGTNHIYIEIYWKSNIRIII